ncbi:hypothetical protein [Calothrix sp. UHCC 0171]|uniref:hypothetical protein n=1 Tax=Calothrix sp. UHCC 0171 TaxID=3110245 RepID=UPI002B21678C|nr:hypothetical protein [Calothrix sp. UHCC 0171]MEA5572402.1 hypothetical protein [Calothrix sp. UHCC 0171]
MRGQDVIPFHEKSDTDVNPESFAASKFFNCVSEALPKEALRLANCELVLALRTNHANVLQFLLDA